MKWLLILIVVFVLGRVTTELVVWNSGKRVDKNMVALSVNVLLHALGHGRERERNQGRGNQSLQMA